MPNQNHRKDIFAALWTFVVRTHLSVWVEVWIENIQIEHLTTTNNMQAKQKIIISLLSHLKKVFFVAVNKTLSIFQPNGSLMTDILVCKDEANGS